MYEEEYRTLLGLLSAAMGGAPYTEPIADYRPILLLAKQHSLQNALYYALADDPALPPAYRSALEGQLFSGAHRQLLQERETARIEAALQEAHIRYLPMKGAAMRVLYPHPEMRISCDVDFFYDKQARAQMDALFASLGYEKGENDPNHTAYQKGTVTVEMHHNLVTHMKTIEAYYRDPWHRFLPAGGTAYRMRDEDAYIYHIIHTMKHFVEGGIGIRAVLDTYVFLRERANMDLAYLQGELTQLGLWEFHLAMRDLSAAWFGGASLPPDLADVSLYICSSGTYGTTVHKAANRGGHGSRFSYLRHMLFPSYHYMVEKYPSLRHFPPALPCYWVYRMFCAAFSRHSTAGSEVNAVQHMGDKEAAARVVAVMQRVGLRGYR